MIKREQYLNKLKKYRDHQIIKVITGIRRCGKSTLLRLFQQELLEEGVSEEQLHPEKTYVFLDEIQMVPSFERAVNSLFLKENVDIYLIGSNAQKQS